MKIVLKVLKSEHSAAVKLLEAANSALEDARSIKDTMQATVDEFQAAITALDSLPLMGVEEKTVEK